MAPAELFEFERASAARGGLHVDQAPGEFAVGQGADLRADDILRGTAPSRVRCVRVVARVLPRACRPRLGTDGARTAGALCMFAAERTPGRVGGAAVRARFEGVVPPSEIPPLHLTSGNAPFTPRKAAVSGRLTSHFPGIVA